MIKNWKKDVWTIPNLLSFFRLILIPVYVTIYLKATEPAHYYIAGGILTVSCLTDMIDGKIARHFNMISTVGKILDPIADKATQFSITVCLAIKHPVLWYLLMLFIVKEGFQLVAGLITLRQGKMLTGALIAGKICTTVMFTSLIILVVFQNLSEKAVFGIMILDSVFMLISLISYIWVYITKSCKVQKL